MTQVPPPPPPPATPTDFNALDPMLAPRKGMSVASLVLGIVSIPTTCVCIGPILGLIAVILGTFSLVRAAGDPTRFGGRGLAVGGIICGAISFVMLAVVGYGISYAWPVIRTGYTLNIVNRALSQYHSDYGLYPPDLDTLQAAGIPDPWGTLDDANNPLMGFHYTRNLGPDAPADWIVASRAFRIGDEQFVGALLADGVFKIYSQAEFEQILSDFKTHYGELRGTPPEIVEH